MIVVLILFCLACGQSSIEGIWETSSGSQMYLQMYRGLILDGWFNSSNPDRSGTYPLNGLLGATPSDSTGLVVSGGLQHTNRFKRVLCFGVVWQNGLLDSNSVTSWNGVFDATKQTIQTRWITTTNNTSVIGMDTFTRS